MPYYFPMNGFQTDDPFGDVLKTTNQAHLERELRLLESEYFQGIPPVVGIQIGDAEGPAKLTPEGHIVIDPKAANWPRVRSLLIIHELIHHSRWRRGDEQYAEHDDVVTRRNIQ
jgi:hypothetical protein